MTRREQLAELDRLTSALCDGTDQLVRQLAAVEAVAYPNTGPRRRRS
jgi:hypothetical protein